MSGRKRWTHLDQMVGQGIGKSDKRDAVEASRMQTIGRITKADLTDLEKTGLEPKQALDAILAEAKARHPKAISVHVMKATLHDGFDIIAL